ncbi:MAG: VirB4 family type IV secretion/conjugal transfer ATPase [Methylophilaceae bacterium]|nr:VirB4 family type IV secretion/conjugal transfer ATPase [Methylophilaceae bacterium]
MALQQKRVQFDVRREDFASKHIPYFLYVTDSIVSTLEGDFVSTWRIQGLPFEGLSQQDALARMDSLNLFIRSLSNGQFAFWMHRVRRHISATLELNDLVQGFSRDLIEKYQQRLKDGGLMDTEIYLSVIYRPFPQKISKGFFRFLANDDVDLEQVRDKAIEIFAGINSQLKSSLSRYGVKQLTTFERPHPELNDNIKFSSQTAFYAYLVNGHDWKIPVKNVPLNEYLPVTRNLFGNQIMEARDTYGSRYGSFIEIKDYAEFTYPGILNGLLGLPVEYVETQSFSPLSYPDAAKALKLQRGRLGVGGDDATSQIYALNDALDRLASGQFSYGEYHYTLQIKGNTPEAVREGRSAAIQILNNAGFLAVVVDGVLDHAFWSQLPANWKNRTRVAKLSSRNFTGLCAMHNFSTGKSTGNPWGDAVALLKTAAGQPYYFNFHATDPTEDSYDTKALGNTQIIGQSGGGKTVLALFLMASLRKFGTQTVFFDKDRGAEIAIRAMGGKYLRLERGTSFGFAPFKLEPTQQNMLFWEDLLKFCASHNGFPLMPREELDIANAVRAVSQLPQHIRGFEAVCQNLPQVDDNSVAARLRKWCRGERFGWALDGDADLLEFATDAPTGFDYTELLDDQNIMPAVMMYLMFRVENIIDGRRFAFFMDEYWKALSVSYFEDFAKNKQKTIRKQNGFGVYMTQSPSDTLQSPIAKALIEQTATFIFLPNPTADREDYMSGFKLTETEFNVVRGLQEGSRMFLIKQGEAVAMATLDLRGFNDELKILSGTTDNVARLDGLRERFGDDPNAWIEAFLRGEKR